MNTHVFDNKHYNTAGHAHELTFSCYKRFSYFKDEIACRMFLESIQKAKNKFNFKLWAYVIMPNHVHLLIWPCENDYDIGKMLQAINGTMSRRYSRLLSRINPTYRATFLEKKDNRETFRFWQRGGGFDRNLFRSDAVHASIKYIENNPVRAKIVSQANEYRWSSAWVPGPWPQVPFR
jgi:putative transposase